ncbi:DUF6057 family protein [Parabacteroides sp. OttesenSCG-928-G06]|nr:DUF6057 family protein [Parabacteroides sp. OttesenSCG-928-G06]
MKHLHRILFLLLAGLFAIMFLDSLSHIPVYHEQHHLFLFSSEYFLKHLNLQGGLLDYVTSFVIQFFYLPYMGSILFALLLSLPYLLNVLICRRLTQATDYLQLALIPSLFLFIRYESIDFPVQHAVGFCLSMFSFYLLSLTPGKVKYYGIIPVTLLLALLTGWLYTLIALVALLLPCLSALQFKKIQKRKLLPLLTACILLVYAAAAFYSFVSSYNMREHLILKAEEAVKKQDWERVMHYCRRYRGNNQLIFYFNNMALYHTGRMPYDLLKQPQDMGVLSLFLPWQSDSRQSEYGHYLYEQLGYTNEAHRWAFEAMVVMGETPPTLQNLIRYNIDMNRPEVAMRFIRILKKSLFYRRHALHYEQMIREKRQKPAEMASDETIRFANIMNIGPELQYLVDRDPHNKMAYEYLMSFLLLSNDRKRFAENLPLWKNFYKEIPPLYKQMSDRIDSENNLLP